MRLLVTRPEPDATRTAERLRGLGHTVLVQPLLTIAFYPAPQDVPQPAAVLVTSQNGLRALAAWPQAAGWRGVPVFAAGAATARAAAELGFTDVRSGAGDAGTLAELVMRTMPKGRGPLVYPAARDRAGALTAGLLVGGYDIRTVEAYRAEAATAFDEGVRDALALHALDGVLLYSRRTATAFRDLVAASGIRLGRLTAFAISDQVAEVVAGTLPVKVAATPDEDALLGLIPPVGRAGD
ncbi:MAG: uroporphyrinogen-III synthase [Bauldia sp.]